MRPLQKKRAPLDLPPRQRRASTVAHFSISCSTSGHSNIAICSRLRRLDLEPTSFATWTSDRACHYHVGPTLPTNPRSSLATYYITTISVIIHILRNVALYKLGVYGLNQMVDSLSQQIKIQDSKPSSSTPNLNITNIIIKLRPLCISNNSYSMCSTSIKQNTQPREQNTNTKQISEGNEL